MSMQFYEEFDEEGGLANHPVTPMPTKATQEEGSDPVKALEYILLNVLKVPKNGA